LGTLESTGSRKYGISVGFSPDGRWLGVGGGQTLTLASWAQVFDLETRRPVRELSGHSGVVMAISFSRDGKWIATASRDGTLKLWPTVPISPSVRLTGHDQVVTAVAVSSDGRRIATGSFDQTARIWEADSGVLSQTIPAGFPVVSLAFSPDGSQLLTPGPDHTACVWPLAPPHAQPRVASAGNGEVLRLRGHDRAVMTVAWSSDNRFIATGSKDSTARIWDARTGKELRSLAGHTGWIRSLAIAPDGKLLVTGSDDRTVRMWCSESGRCLRVLTNHTGAVLSLVFSPDGQRFASGSDDLTARIWETRTGRQSVPPLQGHPQGVGGLAFSPDGQRLATAAGGRGFHEVVNRGFEVRLWDVQSGHQLLSLVPHTNSVYALAFSPDGRRLITGSFDNMAAVQTAFPWKSADYPGDRGVSQATRIEAYKRALWRSTAGQSTNHAQSPSDTPQRRLVSHWLGELNLPLAGVKSLPLRPIPPRPAQLGPGQIDLTGVYNVALDESWQPADSVDQLDRNLAALPAGCQTFADVTFDVRGLIQLRRAASDFELFPEKTIIPVHRAFQRMHCLYDDRGFGLPLP
jgi:WD40 repeat protein